MLKLFEAHRLQRRHLFAGGAIAAILAAFRAGPLPKARMEQTQDAVTAASRVPHHSASDADDWIDFDKSG